MPYILIVVALFTSAIIFKSRMIQLVLIFLAYPIFITALLLIGIEPKRIISNVGDFYYSDLYLEAFYFQVLCYLTFFMAIFTLRKSEFNVPRLSLGQDIRLTLLGMLFLFYPIAYPAIFGLGDGRFGSGGSVLIVINSLLLITRKNRIDIADVGMLSINLFAFISGERADTILVLFLYFILKPDDGRIKERNISNYSFMLGGVFIAVLAMMSGMLRAGESLNLSVHSIFNYLISQGTAVDVAHVYFSSFWYVDKYGVDLRPLINIVSSFLPMFSWGGASSDFNVTEILRNHIPNVGGGLFYSAFYLSLGWVGLCLVFVYGYLLKLFYRNDSIFNFLFIALFIQQLRIQWYGINYLGNVISLGLIIIFFLVLLKMTFLNKKLKNNL
ncbi:hypothetical protein N5212_000307 [Vibrio parahaemolyticus]|nr:hypothetical protein [Vibrio parahaemolyticus]